MTFGQIEVDGLRRFQQAARRSGRDIPKQIGRAHRLTGELVKARLRPAPTPAAVGAGAGAAVRASSAKREVLLRVGGKHRAGNTPYMQWGRRPARTPGQPAPARPYIRRTVEEHRDEIERFYLNAIKQATQSTFWKSEFRG